MKKDVVIIGGGCIGLMSAYCLQKSGRSVTVIDKNDITNGTSFGNAGLLSAFKKAPLSAPGAITDTLKLMLKGESPASVHPTLNLHLYKWLLKFAASSTQARLKRTLALFERYGQISLDMYESMVNDDGIDFHFRKDGLLMIYTEQETFDAKAAHCNDPKAYEILSKERTKEYMPILNEKVIGSILLKENGHIDPGEMMLALKKYLEEKGVEFLLNEEVDRLEFEGSKVSKIRTSKNVYEAQTFILSTGADDKLARQAKNKFMMTPAKGYSLTFKMDDELKPKTTSLFADLFIAMTPRRDTVRMTSKLELGTTDPSIVKKQIDSIKKNLAQYTNDFERRDVVEWSGFRPLTPNDIPILGFDENYNNLVHATGLGWLGITFAPSIGKIINDVITVDKKNETNEDILLFSSFFQG
ncbi:NAD(P)/FAD-dependent oxidoreductase [Poseidonibacter ostreae]|jgi:D-amino-acid dehydrogenase|uniref:FAD-dependent oxidoreductase n=1 Tax=Poseidonibacter ostreae TaxID=2654171 RepID=A0A6L4WRF7_9BACT|nr:FAD-dependent oxidoreductase [Poseidonibacter ostreae]KAB7886116.1 FAD-dependent oxidoreductase [Poseidonibacter ostreae]KAB7888210.1 FAD-dependent oxidoreductase [Poseidonibacter ostreae]KAB7889798.1 FAD-dependent oxidoreductase [Poseidonibacter ostreae]MAC84412.1 FAD-dependent oxidoreductase [Arcobacter sp.]|tara:strand:- start:1422 stop:2660 length:1239 start_codon:yes stop_codon:yes gene_type:complete